MGLPEEFEEYAEKAKTLPENTTNETKLILYGLYKQATVWMVFIVNALASLDPCWIPTGN